MKRTKSKEYEMVKSVLPSRWAKQAKWHKDHLHRRNRRTSNMQCHMLLDVDTDDIDDDLTYWGEPHRSYGKDYDIVYDRRDADHLNHFIAWAWLKTKHLPQEDKMSWMKAHCPMGLLGYHAMSHLKPYLGPRDPFQAEWLDKYDIPERFRNEPNKTRDDREISLQEFWNFLNELCTDPKRLAAFNNYLTGEFNARRKNAEAGAQTTYARYRSDYSYTGFDLKWWWELSAEERQEAKDKAVARFDKENKLRIFKGHLDRYKFYDEFKPKWHFIANYIKHEND